MDASALFNLIISGIAILTSTVALYNSAAAKRKTEAETRSIDQVTASSVNADLRLELARLTVKIEMLESLITALKERIETVLAENAVLSHENRELRRDALRKQREEGAG